MIKKIAFFLFIFFFNYQLAMAKISGKIVGGEEAIEGEFPFMVSLQTGGGHSCGGALITQDWILTAAHCLEGGNPAAAAMGLQYLSDPSGAEIIETRRVVLHPNYNSETVDYDFALIQLQKPSKFQPISLWQKSVEGKSLGATVIGWGFNFETAESLTSSLMKVDVPLVDKSICQKSFSKEVVTDRMLCAGFSEGGKDACQGDSGGPLFFQKDGKAYLIGVVSWGEGCARLGKFGVYSKVSEVLDWIKTAIK